MNEAQRRKNLAEALSASFRKTPALCCASSHVRASVHIQTVRQC